MKFDFILLDTYRESMHAAANTFQKHSPNRLQAGTMAISSE